MMNFGWRNRFFLLVAGVAAVLCGAVSAQNLSDASPLAEFPPLSYSANQYVDSRGCVFVRAGIGGAVDWVPRVTLDRAQLCGFQPTQIANTTTTAPSSTANVPNPLDMPVAELDAGPAPPPAPAARNPAPTPAPAAPADETGALRMTRTQACSEMATTGQRYVSASTGLPIQCGPQSHRVAATPLAPVQTPVQAEGQAAPRRNSNSPDIAPESTVSPGLLTLTSTPFSNPPRAVARSAPVVPSGYARVWNDGRLNTQRGLPTNAQ